jgi:hypothetical protein
VTGICAGGPGDIKYQVVGLCKNGATQSSRFVTGSWETNKASFVACSWYETPQPHPYVRTG